MYLPPTLNAHIISFTLEGDKETNTQQLGLYLRTTQADESLNILLARHPDVATNDIVASGNGGLTEAIAIVAASGFSLNGSITLRSRPSEDFRLIASLCTDDDLRSVDSIVDKLLDSNGEHRGELGFAAIRREVSRELYADLRARLSQQTPLNELRVSAGLQRLVADICVARLLASEGYLEEDEAAHRVAAAKRGLRDVALSFTDDAPSATLALAKLVRG